MQKFIRIQMLQSRRTLVFKAIAQPITSHKITCHILLHPKKILQAKNMIKVESRNTSSRAITTIWKSSTIRIFQMRALGYTPIPTHPSLAISKSNKVLKSQCLRPIAKRISPLESCHRWPNKATTRKTNQPQPTLPKVCIWIMPKLIRKAKINSPSKSSFFYKTIKRRRKASSMSKLICYHLRIVHESHLTTKSLIGSTKPTQLLSRVKEPLRSK